MSNDETNKEVKEVETITLPDSSEGENKDDEELITEETVKEEESSVMRTIKKKLGKSWEKIRKNKHHFEGQRERVAEAYPEGGNDELPNPNDISNT